MVPMILLGYVSRKFRQLTMCSRNLYFKLGCDSKKCTPNCKQVQGFLKGFLNQHNEPQIDRFRLHWFCRASRYDVKGPIFSLCAQKTLWHKVQELDIGVPVTAGRAFHLPAGIESLRALKLELQGGKPKLFALVFASLETLSLSSVSVPGLELGEWMSHSCRSLKVLNLVDIDGIKDLNISNSCLKALTVSSCSAIKPKDLYYRYTRWYDTAPEDGIIFIHCYSLEKLEICKCGFDNLYLNVNAPCLKDLQISNCEIYGSFDVRISAEQLQTMCLTMELCFCVPEASLSRCRIYSDNLRSLSKATINLAVPYSSTLGIADYTCKEFNSNGLVEFIYSVRYAKSLQLNFQIIKALSNHAQLQNITFQHLEHLEASVADLNNLKDIDIADFLRCCSCLNTLTFKYDSNADQLSETELVDQLQSKLGDECGNTRFAYRVINCKDSENKGFNGRV
ncbi:hypothetical protein Gohar_020203 [Gossypium harknessii]|uniref:At1g61320/AtMIF1 LRR domain-containing protein n=1 Tax=Gossypium harknessii TaxID=34285 RepID=A0A7J9HWX5_9ROSI|nr:hypothetical protein [Gossypium harknessii]